MKTMLVNIVRKIQRRFWQKDTSYIYQNQGYCWSCNRNVQFTARQKWWRDHYRCDNCNSIPRERAVMYCLEKFFPNWKEKIIHETSPVRRGTSLRLEKEAKTYIPTQYFLGIPSGSIHKNFRNENLEKLSFDNESIDLHISQDVFEHVLNPDKAFQEIARTLKPGGAHVFTTPLVNKSKQTKFCAKENPDGTIEQLIFPKEFHGNPVSPEGSLVTVRWGYDISQYIFKSSGLFTEMVFIDAIEYGIRAEYIEVLISRKT